MTDKGKLELLRGNWSPVVASAAGKLRVLPVVSAVGAADPPKSYQTVASALALYLEYPSAAGWSQAPASRPAMPALVSSQDDVADTASVSTAGSTSLGALQDIDSAGGVYVGQRVRGLWITYTVGSTPDNSVDYPVYWVDGPLIEGQNGSGQSVDISFPSDFGVLGDDFAFNPNARMFNIAKKKLLDGAWSPEGSSALGLLRVMLVIGDTGETFMDPSLTTVDECITHLSYREYDGAGWPTTQNRPALRPMTALLDAQGIGAGAGYPVTAATPSATHETPIPPINLATKKVQGALVTCTVAGQPNNAIDFPVVYWIGEGITGMNGEGSSMFIQWLNQMFMLLDS